MAKLILNLSDENKNGEKHLVALTFSIREQQIKATFSDSQNVSQIAGEEENLFTTPSMEDMLKKENAMLMDLVKVVSNDIANNKLKELTDPSQITQAMNSNPENSQRHSHNGNKGVVNHPPRPLGTMRVEKKQVSDVKRAEQSVPESKVDKENGHDGNGTQVEKKDVQKATIIKIFEKPKSSESGSRFPGSKRTGMKSMGLRKQEPSTVPSFEEQEPHKQPPNNEVKPSEPQSFVNDLAGNEQEIDDSGEDSEEGGEEEGLSENSDGDEELPENDDKEVDIAGTEDEGDESMDENDAPKKKNTETVERIVIEESKKFKSKLTETFKKNSDDTNTLTDNSEDDISDVTEEALPDGDKKLVDKTAKMMEAISILYKLAGNESKSDDNDVFKRDEKDSVPANDSVSGRDVTAPKDPNPQKNTMPGNNSIAGKENESLSSGTTVNPIIENISIALASSLPTVDSTAKKNRKRKFIIGRESNEVTTVHGAEDTRTQIIKEATPEDQFTQEMEVVTAGVYKDPADNIEKKSDDLVQPTEDDGEPQTDFMDRFTDEEPSTIDIEDVGDDFTTDANMDLVI